MNKLLLPHESGELLKALQEQAVEQDWRLERAIQTHLGGNGYVPHGFALVARSHSPFGPERVYATVGWNDHRRDGEGGGVHFEQGHYDLTHADALADLEERVS